MIVKNLIKDKERFDKRKLDECRIIKTTIEDNLVHVKAGTTEITVSSDVNIFEPYIDKPHEGIVGINVFTGSRRGESLSNFLYKIFVKNRCIDLESLCIKFGKEVYHVNIDIRVLSFDGNLYSVLTAGVNEILKKLEITVNFYPQTFMFLSICDNIVSDPSEMEINESDWFCIVTMKSYREILYVEKSGMDCSISNVLCVVDKAYEQYIK